jgi:hypothetical protein
MRLLSENHLPVAFALAIALHESSQAADARRFDLIARASEIDPRAKEHPIDQKK